MHANSKIFQSHMVFFKLEFREFYSAFHSACTYESRWRLNIGSLTSKLLSRDSKIMNRIGESCSRNPYVFWNNSKHKETCYCLVYKREATWCSGLHCVNSDAEGNGTTKNTQIKVGDAWQSSLLTNLDCGRSPAHVWKMSWAQRPQSRRG